MTLVAASVDVEGSSADAARSQVYDVARSRATTEE